MATKQLTLLKGISVLPYGHARRRSRGYRLDTGLPFDAVDDPYPEDEPYIFHFPDGNASVARLLVRKLIPSVAPGNTMEDIVTTRFDYARLDETASPIRIRLNSTALRVQPGDAGVTVTYARSGELVRVRGHKCVLACYNAMIPYLLPELAEEQRSALAEAVRTPLVYTNVVLWNWQSFVAAGVDRFYNPTGYYAYGMLDFPVSLGEYTFPRSPDDPILVHMSRRRCPAMAAATWTSSAPDTAARHDFRTNGRRPRRHDGLLTARQSALDIVGRRSPLATFTPGHNELFDPRRRK